MPTLSSALAMDGDNYLHPEGPQLDVSIFPAASPNNMEVWFSLVLYVVGGDIAQHYKAIVHVVIKAQNLTDVLIDELRTKLDIGPSQTRTAFKIGQSASAQSAWAQHPDFF